MTVRDPVPWEGKAPAESSSCQNADEPRKITERPTNLAAATPTEAAAMRAALSGQSSPRRTRGRRAFSLLELLVVIAIIALLVSMLSPAGSRARTEATAAKCLANLRSILQFSAMYMDNDDQRLIPWYQYPPHRAYDGQVQVCTPWVFGGFRAPNPEPGTNDVDSSLYPAQLRPLNAYAAPQVQGSLLSTDRGRDVIELYQCPSDCSYSAALISHDAWIVGEEDRASWEANGSSYTLNARWAQGYTQPSGDYILDDFMLGRPPENIPFGKKLAPHLIGDGASRFILWAEQGFYSATYRATASLPNRATPQRRGWHRKFSTWSVGFADGHALYGYYDTRLIYGLGGTIWQPNLRP
jgi:prepilin-type N-terminal cleavage/methylation domain-containing protein